MACWAELLVLCLLVRESGLFHLFFFLVKQVTSTNSITIAPKQLTVWNPISLDFSQFK